MSTDTRARPDPNVDPAELSKFGSLAHQWWDPESDMFGPLHRMNPSPVRRSTTPQPCPIGDHFANGKDSRARRVGCSS